MFNFEKLDVWQKGIVFADLAYPRRARFRRTNALG